MQVTKTIAQQVDAADGKYDWPVPAYAPDGTHWIAVVVARTNSWIGGDREATFAVRSSTSNAHADCVAASHYCAKGGLCYPCSECHLSNDAVDL